MVTVPAARSALVVRVLTGEELAAVLVEALAHGPASAAQTVWALVARDRGYGSVTELALADGPDVPADVALPVDQWEAIAAACADRPTWARFAPLRGGACPT